MTEIQLSALPYAYDALSPFISAETLKFHHDKHHKSYVDKFNKLISGTDFENSTIDEVIRESSGSLFNNAAQAWNHSFYWQCLTPKKSQALTGGLMKAIQRDFGSFENFRDKFILTAADLFGSGWVWLAKDQGGKLSIVPGKDAENPIRQGLIPVFTCDVWEHAYYIDYRNERARYLQAFWEIANWQFAEKCFESDEFVRQIAA